MPRHRSHSTDFKRQVVAEYHAGETLHALGPRHDLSRSLIRIWVEKAEAGSLDQDMASAELLSEYEARIAALERLVGRQALEIEFQKGDPNNARLPRSGLPPVIAGPGFVYVAVILDAWSRRVVGYAIGRSLDARHAVAGARAGGGAATPAARLRVPHRSRIARQTRTSRRNTLMKELAMTTGKWRSARSGRKARARQAGRSNAARTPAGVLVGDRGRALERRRRGGRGSQVVPGGRRHATIAFRTLGGRRRRGGICRSSSGRRSRFSAHAGTALLAGPKNLPYLFVGCHGPDPFFFNTKDLAPTLSKFIEIYN